MLVSKLTLILCDLLREMRDCRLSNILHNIDKPARSDPTHLHKPLASGAVRDGRMHTCSTDARSQNCDRICGTTCTISIFASSTARSLQVCQAIDDSMAHCTMLTSSFTPRALTLGSSLRS
jgi:hypothetical protein